MTITNGVIFSEPVYNYSRDFPYIWEEIAVPIAYDEDRDTVERIMLRAARAHTVVDDPAAHRSLDRMRSRYTMSDASIEPAVFWRITDNWLELSVRFLWSQTAEFARSRTRSAATSSPIWTPTTSRSPPRPTTSWLAQDPNPWAATGPSTGRREG